jgi:beta-galactosidase
MMNPRTLVRTLALTTALVLAPRPAIAASDAGRERLRFDAGWRFAIGHPSDPARDFGHATGYFSYLAKTGFGDGPAAPSFDDRGWRRLDLPHDWAVELPFDGRASHSHGYRTVGPRFPDTSVGWYRRTFQIPNEDLGRRIRIEFDGVYRAARVFVNGFFVGEEPSGYLPASYDITDYVNYGGDNVVAVRVDASMEEGWFYEGAGIYRHVWLEKTAPVHVARHGTWVRTSLADGAALVTVDSTVQNESASPADCSVSLTVLSPTGETLAQTGPLALHVAPGVASRTDELRVSHPALWSVETPTLHRLVTEIRQGTKLVDRTETPFGIRTIRFDPNTGFYLNGQPVKLKGTNNHQDHAGVGAAIPDALQDFRIRRLKEMGSNAYRCSHNPPTPELLDACDRLGMLVIDENRLMGSNPFHLRQVEEMILRDRNHPAVILWSLGNEEWGIESNIKGARITASMQAFAQRLDPTRPTTVAISGGWGGTSSVIDVAGVNYIKQANVDKQHADYPQQIIVGTEETTTQCTRGIYFDDRALQHLSPQVDGSSGYNAEIGWQFYDARPFAAGVFYWTGFDYRGEETPFGFPAISSQFGIVDTCGFPKDGFYYLKAWWTAEPLLHVFPHWNWPGREGQPIEVTAHTNCTEVELFLNDRSLGRKPVAKNSHVTWTVPYAPGVLTARGYRGDKEILTSTVKTTGPAKSLALAPDRAAIAADGRDVSVVTVDVRDAAGLPVPTAGNLVTFAVRGPGRIIGVGNGDPSCLEPDVFVESVRTVTLGQWTAPAVDATTPVTFEAQFDRPAATPNASFELLLTAIGTDQQVTLNGADVPAAASAALAPAAIALRPEQLKPTGNVLRVSAKPFAQRGAREHLREVQPAVLRVAVPPAPWQRSLFNGLAQVIIQSTGAPGTITVEASSSGADSATVTLTAR